ncbi:hypothetical protein H5410_048255 [Solanum commersonii]|uniref:Uncharacterized protein n=1 Tax=Solanum commersonii TaxID=4109 RepID=A0A9J5XJ80_SOLCO|nr:hypothetical protein H5410_048255 [Solanum commersonii]
MIGSLKADPVPHKRTIVTVLLLCVFGVKNNTTQNFFYLNNLNWINQIQTDDSHEDNLSNTGDMENHPSTLQETTANSQKKSSDEGTWRY